MQLLMSSSAFKELTKAGRQAGRATDGDSNRSCLWQAPPGQPATSSYIPNPGKVPVRQEKDQLYPMTADGTMTFHSAITSFLGNPDLSQTAILAPSNISFIRDLPLHFFFWHLMPVLAAPQTYLGLAVSTPSPSVPEGLMSWRDNNPPPPSPAYH